MQPTAPAADGAAQRHGAPEVSAVVVSKVQPPVLPRPVVHRSRLVSWLEAKTSQRVVVVTAEAGYGKTTLLGDFSHRTKARCAWYRMESSDRDWMTFLGYLVAAVRQQYPDFGASTEAMLRHIASMAPSRDIVVSTFLSDLDDLPGEDVVVILDDLHNAKESDDVAHILGRLIEHAPQFIHLVLSGRSRPELPLVRVAAQGRLFALATADLRFTRPEMEEMFEAQGRSIGSSNYDVIEKRTEGWAASLQLISASIASSPSDDVDLFINALSGAEGPLYDFLAEEVLSRLSPESQRVLIHASLLEPVRAELVTAALSATSEPVGVDSVAAALLSVESIGLLSPGHKAGDGYHLHPLLKQFLGRELAESSSEKTVAAMHLAVAEAAEESDWLTAAKHYAAGVKPEEAMRVLDVAAVEALGSGAWGAASVVIERIPDRSQTPSVRIIRARALTAEDDPESALQVLDEIDEAQLAGPLAGLFHLARASALHVSGQGPLVPEALRQVVENPETPEAIRDVSDSWAQVLVASRGGSIREVADAAAKLARRLEQDDLGYFSAVTLNNAGTCELAIGNFARADEFAAAALHQLQSKRMGADIASSVRMLRATAEAETGECRQGVRRAVEVAREPGATADTLAEAAYLCAVVGRASDAAYFIDRLDRGDAPHSRDEPVEACRRYAEAAIAMATGEATRLAGAIEAMGPAGIEIDRVSRVALLRAIASTIAGSGDSKVLARRAMETIARQGAWRWAPRAHIVLAAATRDGSSLRTWIEEAAGSSSLAMHECADVVSVNLDLLDPLPAGLERSVVEAPERWIPALTRQLLGPSDAVATAAARLLAKYGRMDDAPSLRAYEEASGRPAKRRGYVAQLIRRVSPTARVHDLGPMSCEVGDRVVAASEQRRRPASLLAFLVTRPRLTTSRDQVMDSLWPDQEPIPALNSLHQTLFFLRRDIEPWYEDGSTADYVRMESDLVFLDADMFQVDSVAFARQASEVVTKPDLAHKGPPLLGLYTGRFAPEFEYEDWALEWRNHVHGLYLHLAQSTAQELDRSSDTHGAIAVLTNAVGVDAFAFDLRGSLIRYLARVGSVDSARMHYQLLSTQYREELGIEPSSFDTLVDGVPP